MTGGQNEANTILAWSHDPRVAQIRRRARSGDFRVAGCLRSDTSTFCCTTHFESHTSISVGRNRVFYEKWFTLPTFPGLVFPATHKARATLVPGTIVAGEYHQGIFTETFALQRLQQCTDTVVDIFHHITIKPRLGFACLLGQNANLLMLDEPTNHLDMSSVEVLIDALTRYEGTVVFVSHDRTFINQLATHVFVMLPDGRSELFMGDLDDYATVFPWRLSVSDTGNEVR